MTGFDEFYRRPWPDAARWATALPFHQRATLVLTFDGVAWGWPGATASGMAEVPAQHRDQWQQRSSATTLADDNRVAIIVTTGTRWDLLEQSSLYPLVTGRAAEARAPRRDQSGRHGRPRQLPRLLGAGGAVVHLTVPLSADLDAVLAVVVVKS